MDPITLIIVAVLGVLAAGMVFSSTFRNKVLTTLRIRSNAVLDKATTAIEREKDEYNKLMGKLPGQRAAVTKVMGAAAVAKKDLDTAVKNVATSENEYKEAKGLGASEAALNELANKFSAAEQAVEDQKKIVAESNSAADEARNALDATTKALAKFASRVEGDERNLHHTTGDTMERISAQSLQIVGDVALTLVTR